MPRQIFIPLQTVQGGCQHLLRDRSIGRQVQTRDRLSFFAADLLEDKGWKEAIGKSDYLLHVASPMPVGEYQKTDIIRPAREGTRRILQAALNAGVPRVVITSSTEACTPEDNGSGIPTDETIWTDLTGPNVGDYTKAKTLAEQDAWAFMKRQKSGMTLTTILPGMVQGPVLGPDYSGSVELITRLLNGKVPRYPNIGFTTVHVRNLADLHIRAMESDAAADERFIGAGQFLWLAEMAHILRERLGAKARKVPTQPIPDWVVRLLAYVSADLCLIAPNLRRRAQVLGGEGRYRARVAYTSSRRPYHRNR